jgi:PAS domain S-box-containing protein
LEVLDWGGRISDFFRISEVEFRISSPLWAWISALFFLRRFAIHTAMSRTSGTTPPEKSEKRRLEVLWEYEILDTPAEQVFDDLTTLAAHICGAPIALISLVDEDRQWFKSRLGISEAETSRDISFCAHAIQGDGLFIVPDAANDPRFANNPLVTGDPKIRFYAGAPLISPENEVLGTLCVIDRQPRQIGPEQEQALRILSRQIMTQLDLRRRSRLLAQAQAERAEAQAALMAREAEAKNLLAAEQQARAQSEAAEAQYRLLMEAMPDLVWTAAPDGALEYFNESCMDYFQGTYDQMKGWGWQEALHPEDRPHCLEVWRRSLKTGANYEIEFRLRRASDGAYRWHLGRALPLRDPQGRIVKWVGTATNIDDLKRLEVALKQSEQLYRTLAGHIPNAAVALFNKELKYLLAEGSALRQLTGSSKQMLEGKSIREAHTTKIADRIEPVFTATLAGQPARIEVPFGDSIYLLESHPIKNEHGEIFAGMAMALDITLLKRTEEQLRRAHEELEARVRERTADLARTNEELRQQIAERRQAEEALRDSETRFELVARATNDIVWDWDLTRNTLWWSDGLKKLLGETEMDPGIEGWENRLHPDERERVMAGIHGAINSGQQYWSDEYQLRLGSGAYAHMLDRGYVMQNQAGKPVRMIGAMIDITGRKQAELSIRELAGRLLRLQDQERRRIGRELHDSTAQCLAALEMNLAMLEKASMGPDPRTRQIFSECLTLASQCSSEIRTVAYLLHPPLLDELGLVSALRWYTDGVTQRSGIQVELQVAEDLRRLPEEIELTLFRIVQESLANVLRHSGSPVARIRLKAETDRIELSVEDEGRGLPESVLTGAAGTPVLGVGIAGMKERVRQLGGQLELNSNVKGATVQVWLPLIDRFS